MDIPDRGILLITEVTGEKQLQVAGFLLDDCARAPLPALHALICIKLILLDPPAASNIVSSYLDNHNVFQA